MKKLILLLLMATAFGCKKEEPAPPEFNISGKEYAARWKVNNNNRQEYIHMKFGQSSVNMYYSTEKILKYGDENLAYVKSGDTYNIKGVLNESQYNAKGTVIDWTITPTKHPLYEGSPVKSTFEIEDLTFIDQRP